MRRSVENAEHVGESSFAFPSNKAALNTVIGLFAPRAGQSFRDEQRRRRSQYDRGTRLAEIEESYETSAYQYRGNLSPIAAHAPSIGKYPQELGQMFYSRRAGSF